MLSAIAHLRVPNITMPGPAYLRQVLLQVVLVAFVVGCAVAQDPVGVIIPKPSPNYTSTDVYPYMVYMPTVYGNDTTSFYPLIVCLDGLGQDGDGSSDGTLNQSSTNQLAYVLQLGPLALINNGSTYFSSHPAIIVQPQSTNGKWNTNSINSTITQIAGSIQGGGTYRVDHRRIYLLGLSAGGAGAWIYGQTFASRLAVLVSMAGAAEPSYPVIYTSTNSFSTFNNTIIWGIHDDQDPTVRPTWTTGQVSNKAPTNFAGWVGAIAQASALTGVPQRCLDTHPDKPTVILGGVGGTEPIGLNGVVSTRSGHYSPGSGWSWVDGNIFYPGSRVQITLFKNNTHDGWDQEFGTGNNANATFWNWLLNQEQGISPSGSDSSVAISPVIASVSQGQSVQLNALSRDLNGNILAPQPVFTWTVSSASGAVSSSGLFTANAASGFVTATAQASLSGVQYSGSIAITLTAPSIVFATVAINPASMTMSSGQNLQFTATALNSIGGVLSPQPTFTWSASAGSGIVSSNGLFTANGYPGPVMVSAMTTVSGTTHIGNAIVVVNPVFDPTFKYKIINATSGLALDNSNSTNDGSAIVQNPDSSSTATNQQWQVMSLGNGSWKLLCVASGKSLDNGGSAVASTQVTQNADQSSTNTNQQWVISGIGKGCCSVICNTSRMSLDDPRGVATPGIAIVQYPVDSPPNTDQMWRFVQAQAASPIFPIPGGPFSAPLAVTITSPTVGASIFYTTDGSLPTAASSLYSKAFTISATTTVRAISLAPEMANSTISNTAYTLVTPAPVPLVLFGNGFYADARRAEPDKWNSQEMVLALTE